MPTYVYECGKCGDSVEVWQSFSDEPLKRHGRCGGKLTKVLQPVGIVLKGSGFYRNDNRSSSGARKSDGSEGKSTNGDGSGSKSSDGKGDSKRTGQGANSSEKAKPAPDSKGSSKASTAGTSHG
jgi:putative FmdB family regulatory protein